MVVVGEHLGADAVAAGILLNKKLGSLGTLQTFRHLPELEVETTDSLATLTDKMNGGEVSTLLILGGNPVYTSPGDVGFDSALGKVETSLYLGEYDDETAELCGWSLPLAHPLESWDDCLDNQGQYGVCQPQILPLLSGRSAAEVLAIMLGETETRGEQITRRTIDSIGPSALSDRQWRKLLHDGYGEDGGLILGEPLIAADGSFEPLTDAAPSVIEEVQSDIRDDIEVVFVPGDGPYDGRLANNGWLQELPQSLTKLTWDNAAIMSPATARALEIEHGLMVALRRGEAVVELPVFEMPGCAPGVVTVAYGYGRTRAGAVGGHGDKGIASVGVDVSPIRTSDSWFCGHGHGGSTPLHRL